MITTIVLGSIVFLLAVAGLAAGVIIRGRALRGSCGGLAGLRDEQGKPMCDVCSNPAQDCDEFRGRFSTNAFDRR